MLIRELVGDYFGADLDVPPRAWKAAGLPRRDVEQVGGLTLDEAEAMVSMQVSTTDGERFQANLLGTILVAYEECSKRGKASFERRWRLFLERSKPLPLSAIQDESMARIVGLGAKPSKYGLKVGGKKLQ